MRSLVAAFLACMAGCVPTDNARVSGPVPIRQSDRDAVGRRELADPHLFRRTTTHMEGNAAETAEDAWLVVAVTPFSDHGKLAVCGAYVYSGPRSLLKSVPSYFADDASFIEFATGGTEASVRISPAFMTGYDGGTGGPRPDDLASLTGQCTTTEVPWREGIIAPPKLALFASARNPRTGQNLGMRVFFKEF